MKKLLLALLMPAVIGFTACSDDDKITLQTISVNFTSPEIGIGAADDDATVDFTLTRQAESDIMVQVNYRANGVSYGTDFTTDPAASGSNISFVIPKGRTSGSFTINKDEDLQSSTDKYLELEITNVSSGDDVKIGDRKTMEVIFGELLSASGTMQLEGNAGGVTAANSVYVDFSQSRQVAVDKKMAYIGLSCGADFSIVLNGANSLAAVSSGKTDIATVGSADAEAITDKFDINRNPMMASIDGKGELSSTIFDSPDGATTAFAKVSENDAENYVYFVASATERALEDRDEWWKVRITRNGEGYTVQYGKVKDATVKTINVNKNEDYNYLFISFTENKVVNFEPKAAKWDIKWGNETALASGMGGSDMLVFGSDIVFLNNKSGVKVATVQVSNVAWENISAANLSGLTFDSERDAIGSTWRVTTGAGAGVVQSQYYVVLDTEGNYYKFRFIRAGISNSPEGGTRGRPELEYKLIKAAE